MSVVYCLGMNQISKKILYFVIRAVVSISLIGFLLFKLGKENLEAFPVYLRSASYRFLIISILIFAIAVIFTAFRWRELLEVQNIKVRFGSLLRLTFISLFFANVLPGVIGGDVVRLYFTAKNTRRGTDSFVSIFIDRLLGMSAVLAIAAFSVCFLIKIPEVKTIALLVLSLFVVFLIAVFFFFNLKSSAVLKRFYKIKAFNLGNKIKEFKNSIVIYRKKKKLLLYAFFLSCIVQLLIAVVSFLTGLFLNLHIPLRYFFLFVPLIQLVMSIPITIAGIGTRELAFVFFFTTVSGIITKMDAFTLGIVYYLVILITSLPGGIAYLLMGGDLRNK